MSRRTASSRRGFTLVEVILAVVLVAFIASATTLSLSQAIRARDSAVGRGQAFARAKEAADRVARDLENAVRDYDPSFVRVRVSSAGGTRAGVLDNAASELLLIARLPARVRSTADPLAPSVPEGAEGEVQYRLQVDPARMARELGSSLSLWRRVDPLPDEYPDAGGVAAPVVDGVRALLIEASDGVAWYAAWESDNEGMPHAVRVTVLAVDSTGRYTAVARRTVAMDRTPLPVDLTEEAPTDGAAAGGSSAAGGAAAGGAR